MPDFSATRAHCSNHSYFATGCVDCSVHDSYREAFESKLQKAERIGIHPLEINIKDPGVQLQLIRNQLSRKIYIFLVAAAAEVEQIVKKEFNTTTKEELFLAAYGAITWQDLIDSIQSDLRTVVKYAGLTAANQLELSDESLLQHLSSLATVYGRDRAAEMASKRWNDQGSLVDDPGAHYSIASTTRDDLQYLIQESEAKSSAAFSEDIRTAKTFSGNRAQLIAATELAMAQFFGHISVWKQSNLIASVNLVLDPSHDVEDECDETYDAGPYSIDQVPTLPLHPNCLCGLQVVELVA